MHRPAWSFLGSPHETEKIVRFGRNAERGDERCVGICLSGVYPSLMSATPALVRQFRVPIVLP